MSGNGVDIAAVYGLLRSVADTVAGLVTQVGELRRDMDVMRQDVDTMRRDVDAMRRDMARKEDLEQLRRSVTDQIAGLRDTVTDYHAAVIGHGSFISELDGRVHRIEQHLGLPPA